MSEHPLFYKDELQKGTLYLLLCGFFAVIAILWRLDANHHDDPFQDSVSSTTPVGLPGIYN